jgi:hypothetical protein
MERYNGPEYELPSAPTPSEETPVAEVSLPTQRRRSFFTEHFHLPHRVEPVAQPRKAPLRAPLPMTPEEAAQYQDLVKENPFY